MKWTISTSMNSIEDRSNWERDHCRQVDSPGLGRVAIWVAPVLLTIRQSRYFYYFNLPLHQTNSHHASESSIDHAKVFLLIWPLVEKVMWSVFSPLSPLPLSITFLLIYIFICIFISHQSHFKQKVNHLHINIHSKHIW